MIKNAGLVIILFLGGLMSCKTAAVSGTKVGGATDVGGQPYLVRLLVERADGTHMRGSGWFFKERLIYTAAHVVDAAKAIHVTILADDKIPWISHMFENSSSRPQCSVQRTVSVVGKQPPVPRSAVRTVNSMPT